MGIDKEIRKELIARYPRIVSDKPIERAVVPPHGQQWVEIEDVLTRLHSLLGPRYNYEYTGDELCEAILAPVMQLFATGLVGTYVLCADEPSRVPKEKAPEQQRRLEPDRVTRRFAATNPNEAAALDAAQRCPQQQQQQPRSHLSPSALRRKEDQAALQRVYPADALVVAEGICYRPQLANGTRVQQAITETLHLPSLLRQRTARTSIWTYLVEYLSKSNPMMLMPGELVIDHWSEGPIRFASDSQGAQRLGHLRHPFGEGEIMCIFWANYYARFPRVIHSIDTDVLPLAVHFLTIAAVEHSGPLLWQYNATTSINLRLLNDTMLRRHDMSSHEFLVWCIVCGADYFDKANIFAGYGCNAIRPWIHATRKLTATIAESVVSASASASDSKTPADADDDKLSLFKAFVAQCRASAERKNKAPSEEQQRVAFRDFLFLYRYWAIRWNDFPRAPPTPPTPRLTHDASPPALEASTT